MEIRYVYLYLRPLITKTLAFPELKAPIKITLIYLVCGLSWILLSDSIVHNLLKFDRDQFTQLHTAKGIAFICCTSLLLYFLVARFYSALGHKIATLKETNTLLEESEKRYSDLFRLSPLPMWVFNTDTFAFLAVNDAAVKQYGYTREEFLKMTIKDVRRESDIPILLNTIQTSQNKGRFIFRGQFTHRRKNGDLLDVEIRSNDIFYKGIAAKVVLINDITERSNYISAIEKQNAKLQEIAWMQSHVVRAPLARMMGFIHLLQDCKMPHDEKEDIMKNILSSATELDTIIKEISDKAHNVV